MNINIKKKRSVNAKSIWAEEKLKNSVSMKFIFREYILSTRLCKTHVVIRGNIKYCVIMIVGGV